MTIIFTVILFTYCYGNNAVSTNQTYALLSYSKWDISRKHTLTVLPNNDILLILTPKQN